MCQDEVQQYINNKVDVWINYNNEIGVWQYSVQVINDYLWLDSFKYKKDAIKFCKKYGLKII